MAKKILKPWGYEEILELNKHYCLKKLFMKKNHRCSLQFHKKKIAMLLFNNQITIRFIVHC